jgi:hypothetical protein
MGSVTYTRGREKKETVEELNKQTEANTTIYDNGVMKLCKVPSATDLKKTTFADVISIIFRNAWDFKFSEMLCSVILP